ncbi:hypothetical protein Y1Q_0022563 [Alligator mississippiensis]|uniref:Uncharacterized protein n=1 Tax=Alligator mississippiensis TaxID=8496 RepID=A0A151NQ45_ALLMI|nr:hypothetical protein Y1Q_0022563 [Alligator mississippiensis]
MSLDTLARSLRRSGCIGRGKGASIESHLPSSLIRCIWWCLEGLADTETLLREALYKPHGERQFLPSGATGAPSNQSQLGPASAGKRPFALLPSSPCEVRDVTTSGKYNKEKSCLHQHEEARMQWGPAGRRGWIDWTCA